jgi:hypothetical protein
MLALDGSSLAEQLVMEEAKRLRLVDRQAPGGCILPSGLIKVEEVFGKAKASQVPDRPPSTPPTPSGTRPSSRRICH